MMKYSVVIATYNGEKYIIEQIESIISQTFPVWEIIICDDHSSDSTIDMITKYFINKNIKHSIIIHESNKGVVNTFMDAIAVATGDYIFLCDQDDLWVPDKVKRMDLLIKEYGSKFIFSNAELIDQYGNSDGNNMWSMIGFSLLKEGEVRKIGKGELVPLLLKRNIITGMTIVIEKNFINSLLPFPDCILHDSWLAFAANVCGEILAVNEPLVKYRQHENNVIGAKDISITIKISNGLKNYRSNVLKQYMKAEVFRSYIYNTKQLEFSNIIDNYYLFMLQRLKIVKGESSKINFLKLKLKGFYRLYFIHSFKFFLKDIIFCIFSK